MPLRSWTTIQRRTRYNPLEEHAADPRPERYGYDALAGARTGDRVWNAAQRQLL